MSLYEDLGGPQWRTGSHDRWLWGDPCTDEWASLNCSDAGRVIGLDLRGVGLTGPLPVELQYMTALQTIDVRDNGIEYPQGADARATFDEATRACRFGATICLGLPPDSCSAFGSSYILSIADPNECDKCPDSLIGPALAFIGQHPCTSLVIVP